MGGVFDAADGAGIPLPHDQGASGDRGQRCSLSFCRRRSSIWTLTQLKGAEAYLRNSIAVYERMLADRALMAQIVQLSAVASEAVHLGERSCLLAMAEVPQTHSTSRAN